MNVSTHLDLFSGIGGFGLAARWAGLETIGFVEIDKFCQRVLRKHWPDVPIFENIKTFNATQFRGCWLLTGGYPCQPFSQAGERRGKEDDRHLWPEMFRIIRECRPTWVLAENVAGHITMGLDEVLADLESEDYATRTFVIPACAKDAPHRRDRVWLVSHAKGIRWNAGQYEHESPFETEPPRGWRIRDITRTHSEIGEYRNRDTESGICRISNGLPNRVDRLRGLGNAIVPPVALEIIKAMVECSTRPH